MMRDAPSMSVVVCTYNRASMLRAALDSLASQSLRKSAYEVLIVDNASTDTTRNVFEAFASDNPDVSVEYIYEPTQGLGYARNTGWRSARGSYVAFVDDDCVADVDWLSILLDSFEHTDPKPMSVGGMVLPVYDEQRPPWFKDSYETDSWGASPRFLVRGESFTGCNMAFRKDILMRYGGFDPALAMKGEVIGLAEETELFRRIWSGECDKAVHYYVPGAVVHHKIYAHKMTVSYRLQRAFATGQASWEMERMQSPVRRLLVLGGSIGLVVWHGLKALPGFRARHWQSWAVEALYPVAANLGRISAALRVRVEFLQRSAASGDAK
jgi:glucosyl-dolichyl phosphate glucuronosyltransferase